MKKRFLAAVMSCMLMAGAVTGCGSKTADAATTAATEVTTEAADSGETTVAASEPAAAEGKYLVWSGKEWNEADDAEKAAAAKEYLIETAKIAAKAANQEFTTDMEDAITDDQIAAVEESLKTVFEADESITIQQQLDAASEVMNAVAETEASEDAETAAE